MADEKLKKLTKDSWSYRGGGGTGVVGKDGRGIKTLVRTSGNGAAGTTDTYTITFTDNTTSTFTVHNGKDGRDGTDGTAGKTPVKGTDYFTPKDVSDIVKEVGDEVGTGALIVTANAGVNSLTNVSHTFAQIYEAHQSGKHIVLNVITPSGEINVLRCMTINESFIIFNAISTITGESIVYSVNIFDDNTNVYLSNAIGTTETLSLGVHTDGLIYIFKDGEPIGNGIEMGAIGDIVGNVDSDNIITLSGNLSEGVYTLKYEGADGSVTEIGTLTLSNEVEPTYTNLIPKSTVSPSSTEIYNGKGYKENTRWSSSSAAESSATGVYVTGCIPWTAGGVVRLKNIRMNKNDTASNVRHICSYTGSAWSSQDISADATFNCVWDADGNLTQFTLPNWGNTYFRLNTGYIGDDSILTIDEPIE